MKQILITGVYSYVGNSLESYLNTWNSESAEGPGFQTDKLSLRGGEWERADFGSYDTVVYVAGIAHVDTGKVSPEERERYYMVNRDLAERAARKARAEKVSQFIYMSSVIVYGESAALGKRKHIMADTQPAPANFYGDSKLQGEQRLLGLETADFRVAIVRAPMIYGPGCRGNFRWLYKLARKAPLFPRVPNERSMLYIGNLTEFLRLLILEGTGGIFFPQNREYTDTSRMVQAIGREMGRRIPLWGVLYPLVWLASKIPGKIGTAANKAFGSLTIDQTLSAGALGDYRKYTLEESIRRTVREYEKE